MTNPQQVKACRESIKKFELLQSHALAVCDIRLKEETDYEIFRRKELLALLEKQLSEAQEWCRKRDEHFRIGEAMLKGHTEERVELLIKYSTQQELDPGQVNTERS